MISSYIANLAAFLTIDRMDSPISSGFIAFNISTFLKILVFMNDYIFQLKIWPDRQKLNMEL